MYRLPPEKFSLVLRLSIDVSACSGEPCCSPESQCGEGEGNCKTDADCLSGLVCGSCQAVMNQSVLELVHCCIKRGKKIRSSRNIRTARFEELRSARNIRTVTACEKTRISRNIIKVRLSGIGKSRNNRTVRLQEIS